MAVPLPPPGTRSNSRLVGLAVAIVAIGLLCAGAGVVGGAGWWWNRPQLDDETSTLTTEDVTVADGLPVEDTVMATEPEPEAAEVVADESYRPDWWSPDYWPGGSTTEPVAVVTDVPGEVVVTEPSESPDLPAAPPVYVGFTADGTSFLAPNEAGVDVATAEVMLGNVVDSKRSASGRTEVYWVQGTHQDPNGGGRFDRDRKVVDPDDIREVVGVRTVWTALPGHTDVFVKCVPVHATDYETPGSCLPVQTASR